MAFCKAWCVFEQLVGVIECGIDWHIIVKAYALVDILYIPWVWEQLAAHDGLKV